MSGTERGFFSCLFACCLLLSASVALADGSLWNKGVVADGTDMRYPADFNVFSFNKIDGLWNNAVTFQHIEGPVAAGESLILKSFCLNHDNESDHLTAAVAGGYVTFDNGGTVYGNVYYGHENGYSAPPYNQITYFPNPGQSTVGPLHGALKSPVDFVRAHDDLTYYSDLLFSLATTGETRTVNNAIRFVCSGNRPVEIFQVHAENLGNPTEFHFDNIGNDPVILINVRGDRSAVINYANILPANVNRSKILWNFHTVKEINLTGIAFKGSLLAPWADVEVKWGSFAGTLVANNVSGSAELYHWPFEGYEQLQDKIENEVLVNPVTVVGNHLASEYDDNAPTTVGIVTWSVDETIGTVESAEIRFGLTPTFGMVASVDVTEPSSYYRTLLLGMKPGRTYFFQVVVTTSGGTTYTSTCNSIETGPLPPNLLSVNMSTDLRQYREPGFLISEITFDENLAFILDVDGDVVWWYKYVNNSNITYMCRAVMSYDGKYMLITFDTGKEDPDYLLKVRMDALETEIFANGASHDVTAVNENTIAYLDWGEGGDWYPSVYEMETLDNGITVTRDIFETADVEGYDDWTIPNEEPKLNALRYYPEVMGPWGTLYPKGLYSAGDKAFDIFVINPAVESSDPNDKIVFRLSEVEGADSYKPAEHWNHGHQLLYDNTGITGILIFNTFKTDGAAPNTVIEYALEYSIAENKWTVVGEYEHDIEPGMFTAAFGDVQRLPEGNTMVTVSAPGKIVEFDSDWNKVLELDVHGAVTNRGVGYTCWRPTLYGPPPY